MGAKGKKKKGKKGPPESGWWPGFGTKGRQYDHLRKTLMGGQSSRVNK